MKTRRETRVLHLAGRFLLFLVQSKPHRRLCSVFQNVFQFFVWCSKELWKECRDTPCENDSLGISYEELLVNKELAGCALSVWWQNEQVKLPQSGVIRQQFADGMIASTGAEDSGAEKRRGLHLLLFLPVFPRWQGKEKWEAQTFEEICIEVAFPTALANHLPAWFDQMWVGLVLP